MPTLKRSSTRTEKRVLVIHHSARTRRLLADAWRKHTWSTFEAEGREDGIPLMFQIRPTLITVEVISGQEDGWELVSCIRLFTDVPVAILLYQPDGGPDPKAPKTWDQTPDVLVLKQPIPAAQAISKAQAFWKNTWKRTDTSQGELSI